MDQKANLQRQRNAFKAIKVATNYPKDKVLSTAVIDLLTDLQHFCTAKGIDFDDRLQMARIHFEAETRDGN